MRKILALIAVIAFLASAIPAFAGGAPSESTTAQGAQGDEKSIFQIVADTMPEHVALSEKNRPRPIKTMTIFQEWADGIKEGSQVAKDLSLRGE